jgi:hypothetical protein
MFVAAVAGVVHPRQALPLVEDEVRMRFATAAKGAARSGAGYMV